MNKKTYLFLGIPLILIISVILTIYIKKNNEYIVLEFGMFAGSNWDVANADSYIIIDQAIKRFENEHRNVKIHYNSGILKEDYSEWLSQQALLGKTPDVFMVLTSDFNQFSSVGILKNLENLSKKDDDFDPGVYFTTALNAGKYQETQYALPYETVPTLMFVNKTLLYEEGIEVPENDWTWDDLRNICKRVTKDTDGDGFLDQFGAYNYGWMEAVYSNEGNLFNADGTQGLFTDETVIRSIEFTKELYELNQGQKVTQDDFNKGNVAFMPLPFAEYRTYKAYPYKIKKYSNFKWDCITMPSGESGGNVSEVNSLLMGISNTTAHEELAWEFLKLLTYEEETQMNIFRYSQGVSVLKAVTGSEEAAEILMKNTEENEKIIDNEFLSQVIENGSIAPKFQKYEEALLLADNEILNIIENNKNIGSSLKIFQRTINKYLSQ